MLERGTLAKCVDIVADFSGGEAIFGFIQMDDIHFKSGAREISELLRFLREETSGLSNDGIAEVKRSGL